MGVTEALMEILMYGGDSSNYGDIDLRWETEALMEILIYGRDWSTWRY